MGNHKDDLEYTGDGIRDTAHQLGGNPDEQRVQSAMQEETAKAMHRVAAAVEDLAEEQKKTREDLDELARREI